MRISKVVFIKNALILTVSSLVIRFIGMFFRIWLAGAVGSEGMGLYTQIFSFYVLASAFASTGINTAVTRLVSEELANGNPKCVRKILTKCVAVTLFVAFCSAIIIFFGADFISERLIGDPRATEAIKTLTFSLPFMGLSSCLKGYFIARKKSAPGGSAQIFEQLARIGIIVYIFSRRAAAGIGEACRWVILGDGLAEVCSFLYIYLAFILDKRKSLPKKVGSSPPYSVLSRLRHIALPITVGRYLNSVLRTAESLLVPKKLEDSGLSSADALSVFGVIKGMALPLIFFPASFLSALSTLLIPEMSEAAAKNQTYKVKNTVARCVNITLITALPIAVIFFYAGRELGTIFYRDPDSGEMIKLLAPIIPLMYLDSVCDGLLKGLDQQVFIFRNSMTDSIVRLGLIILLLPRFGIIGFIGIMYLSNAFTCFLNLNRLIKISGAEFSLFRRVVLPGTAAITVGTISYLILEKFHLPALPFTLLFSALTVGAYALIAVKSGCITRDDVL